MIVREDSIAFIAIPKHASFYVQTPEITIPIFEAASLRRANLWNSYRSRLTTPITLFSYCLNPKNSTYLPFSRCQKEDPVPVPDSISNVPQNIFARTRVKEFLSPSRRCTLSTTHRHP